MEVSDELIEGLVWTKMVLEGRNALGYIQAFVFSIYSQSTSFLLKRDFSIAISALICTFYEVIFFSDEERNLKLKRKHSKVGRRLKAGYVVWLSLMAQLCQYHSQDQIFKP